MPSPADHAPDPAEAAVGQLLDGVAAPLGVAPRPVRLPPADDHGYRELTGHTGRPPLPGPTGPVTVARAALGVASAYLDTTLPGVEILTDRARYSGYTRNAPWSANGTFRMLPAADGWFGISLARPADLDAVPALVEGPVREPWSAVAAWLAGVSCAAAAERTALLGFAAAAVPTDPAATDPRSRRPPVAVRLGGRRRPSRPPLVVDLTALWAGPLCAHLLGLAGARVVKIESVARPDGARLGAPAFFDHLHAGHEFVRLDLHAETERLRRLLASADVVLEASRPRALRQLGINAEEYVERGAVWASITAYGRGPGDELRVGFGDDVAAGAGLVAHTETGPVPTGDAVADPLTGAWAAAAVAVALHAERGGLLDVSMAGVAALAAACH